MPANHLDAETRRRGDAETVSVAKTSCPASSCRRVAASFVAAVLLVASTLLAQAPKPGSRFSFEPRPLTKGGTVKVKANSQELAQQGISVLTGDVLIEYQDVKIRADKVTFDDRTQDISAEGHVIVDQGPQRLSADTATYNLTTRAGVLHKARGSFEPSIYFSGEKIEKLDEDTYRLSNGVLTSCDISDPDWSFHVSSALVEVDGYARLRNVALFADRVPILWMPYLLWPTKRDRAQGFLIPRIGNNDVFGEYIENSYFIPLGQSMDFTLRGDFYSEGAVRAGGIFRYVPSTEAGGRFEGYLVQDPDRQKVEWKYQYAHTQEELPGGFRAVIDVRDFSNLDFFKTFERDFAIRTLSSIYSSGYLTKNRPGYSLNIRADRREHLTEAFQRSVVFEQLPTFQYTIYPTRIASTPIYYNLESSAAQLRRKERLQSEATSSEWLRGDLFPTLSMQIKTPPWLSVKPQLSLRETYYTSSIEEDTRLIVDEPLSRFYGQGQVEFVGPSFSRIYNRSLGDFSRFKHVLEPRARYLYTSEVEKQRQVIQFDTVDSPFLPLVGQSIEYSLTNRVLAKQSAAGSSAREIMSITLRQTVSLEEPFRTTLAGGEEFFTPLSLSVRVNPYQSITFDSTASFGNESKRLDQLNMSANLLGKNRYLNFTWFATFLQPDQVGVDSSQFRIGLGSPIWRERLRGDIHINYDAQREEFLERRYALNFTASCFGIAVERREFLSAGFGTDLTADHTITLDLKNVGPLRGSF